MRNVIVKGVALGLVYLNIGCNFRTQSGKETALLLGGCGSVSGSVAGETRFRVVWFVKLGVRFVFRVGRIFFGSMFNLLNINKLWSRLSTHSIA